MSHGTNAGSPTDVLYHFARNAVVRASAGTGKTETLTGIYTHLVAGAWSGKRSLSPTRIVAVTFTDKAAEEMRARVGTALRALRVELALPEAERGVTGSRIAKLILARLGAEGRVPSAEDIDHALTALAGAPITTFHAYASRLLRDLATEAGLDGDFETLPPFEAEEWKEEAAVQAILARLAVRDGEVEALLRDQGGIAGKFGLASVILPLVEELRESGKTPGTLLTGAYGADAVAARLREVRAELGMANDGDWAAAWRTVARAHAEPGAPPNPQSRKTYAAVAEVGAAALLRLGAVTADAASFEAMVLGLDAAVAGKTIANVEPMRTLRVAAQDLTRLPLEAARAQAVVALVEDAMVRYAARKRAQNVVDFTDQIRLVRDVLAANPVLRDEVVSRIDALLVDEFQDTNALQRDIVYLLRAKPGAPTGVPAPGDLAGGGLLVVGDRKQSVYGFRNADVAVFEGVAADLLANDGAEVALSTSYRSVDKLVLGLNVLSAAALHASPDHAFAHAYDDVSESLGSVHAVTDDEPRLTLLDFPSKGDDGSGLDREARAIADYLAQAMGPEGDVFVRSRHSDGGPGLRRATFGDVALLLPALTKVATYTRELERRGIPYSVENGRGLHETVEAKDLYALLSILRDDDDGTALVTVLRGPMAMISDPTLQRLAAGLDRRARWRGLYAGVPADVELGETERARLGAFLSLLGRARQSADRVGFGRTARAVLDETGYRAVLLAQPSGLSRVANLERLLGELIAREDAGEDGRRVGMEFLRRAASRSEPEADPGGSGGNAVRIMTVHRSKGLQFPVVIAGDLGRRGGARARSVLYDRDPKGGFAVKLRVDGEWSKGPRVERVSDVMAAREKAETRRVFYVQITRAEDHLVLVGRNDGVRKSVVEPARAALASAGLLRVVTSDASTSSTSVSNAAPRLDVAVLVALAEERARPVAVPHASVDVSVTQMEDFVLCARRFRARHLLRLPERPRPLPVLDVWDGGAADDPRRRGTALHAILEMMSFADLASDPAAAFEDACARAGESATDDLRARVLAFAKSPLVARLAVLPPAQVRREVPFVMAFPTEDGEVRVRGQIDLLFEADGVLHVVDYKVTAPGKKDAAAKYGFQLALYAEAARRAFGHAPVTTSIMFLDGEARDVASVALGVDVMSALTASLSALQVAARTQQFPGTPRSHCDAIACGYRWLCYPAHSGFPAAATDASAVSPTHG